MKQKLLFAGLLSCLMIMPLRAYDLVGLCQTYCDAYCVYFPLESIPIATLSITETTNIDNKVYYKVDGFRTLGWDSKQILLRIDEQQILLRTITDPKEYVLYDFSLQVGDIVPKVYYDNFAKNEFTYEPPEYRAEALPDTVISVSTYTLPNGETRKLLKIGRGDLNYDIVEGIGCLNNHFFSRIDLYEIPTCSHDMFLVCSSINGELLYAMSEEHLIGIKLTKAACKCVQYETEWCNQWNVLRYRAEYGYGKPTEERTLVYVANGDTTIQERQYTKILSYYSNQPDKKEYAGAVRYEGEKAYLFYDKAEYLLYDFDVQAGDERQIFAGINNVQTAEVRTFRNKVTKVDVLPNGKKQITVDIYSHPNDPNHTETSVLTEGIGSERGFLYTGGFGPIGGFTHFLLCAYRNGQCVYTTENTELTKYGCDYNVDPIDAVENTAAPVLTVLPNPVHDYLELQGAEAVSEVQIYDLSGQCVLRSCAQRVDVTTLPSGIYLLCATDKNGKAYQSKFVKE